MEIRYQVFVSSTFADLKDERARVIQTIMELDCIPAGMEIFPAIDEEQFNFIKRIIDDCDYYILIIGGRYGSISETGVSYTEMEYDYAIEKGIRVMAFIHSDPGSIPFDKSEPDATAREKLEAFKQKVQTGRLVKFWKTAEELPGLVALSLPKTIKTYPAIGWTRATFTNNTEVLQELNEQRKENLELKRQLSEFKNKVEGPVENIASLDSKFTVKGTYYAGSGIYSDWKFDTTWEQLFFILSPKLLEHPHDSKVYEIFSENLFEKTGINGANPKLDKELFETIKIQFKMLGIVKVAYTETTKGGMGLFWSLTPKGEKTMYEIRAVRDGQ